MSRFDELKKQYPELNMTLLDVLKNFDSSGTYKYLPLFCKIFGKAFNPKSQYIDQEDYRRYLNDISEYLDKIKYPADKLTDNQKFFIRTFLNYFPDDYFDLIKLFIEYTEKNIIDNKDVTSYNDIEDIRKSVSLASLKTADKTMKLQVIREYEDDTWIAVRPLTFQSSVKYGASTRWCTTSEKERHHFERYWRKGILVYFINKKTGFKFAGYKSLDGSEFSFWNSEDSRVEIFSLDVEDYLYSIIKNIFKSTESNKNLCSAELQQKVHEDCIPNDYNSQILNEFFIPEGIAITNEESENTIIIPNDSVNVSTTGDPNTFTYTTTIANTQ